MWEMIICDTSEYIYFIVTISVKSLLKLAKKATFCSAVTRYEMSCFFMICDVACQHQAFVAKISC